MCLFPLPNLQFDSLAYRKGVREFDCGACPECLRKRSNTWALRSVYESREHAHNCMVTLTYDNFEYDDNGNIVGELPVNPDLHVNKRDIQLFIKRLRKWYSTVSSEKIKYIACAEYGSRTHRAHYHVILFGVSFPDIHFYKKSKRGNPIYMSSKLSELWSHGICTVDSIRVHSAVARYCTKYCAKSRSDDTFMLCSQKIGFNGLLRDFNGLNYMIDGREYTVPRFVWEYYIVNKYRSKLLSFPYALNLANRYISLLSPKYVNRDRSLSDFDFDLNFDLSKKQRAFYRKVRDKDPVYVRYLSYWQRKGELFEFYKLPARTRILQLEDSKYHFYKVRALRCLDRRKLHGIPDVAPGSKCISAYARYLDNFNLSLAPISRPNRASDTTKPYLIKKGVLRGHFLRPLKESPPRFLKNIQLFIDF